MHRLPFPAVRFRSGFALRVGLSWPRNFLQRVQGALLPYTANGAHCSLRGWLLTKGDAGMAGKGSIPTV